MTIALLISHDYAGGTALWARNMVTGMIANGYDVAVIKSTRQKLSFHPDPEREYRVRNAEEIHKAIKKSGADFAIFQSGYDAHKQITKHPLWMRSLVDFPVPFTFATHDDATSYQHPVAVAYFEQLTKHVNFHGKFMGFSVLPEHMVPEGIEQVESVLPFEPRTDAKLSETRYQEMITLFSYVGRVKQWAFILRAAVLADECRAVHPVTGNPLAFALCGGAATTPGVSTTTRAWTLLRDLSDAVPIDLDVSDPESNVHKPLPWSLVLPNGTEVSYNGRFDQSDVDFKMSEVGMTVNTTTRRGGSLGPTEYVTLEAIRAGARTIAPEENTYGHDHLDLTTYRVFSDKHHTAPDILKGEQDKTIRDMIVALEQEYERPDSALEKRKAALEAKHSPAIVVKTLFDKMEISA